jgi:hypothetical protein
MGLDQYLSKKIYVGAKWEHRNVKAEVKIEADGKEMKVNPKRITYIIEEVGYWRKANQIHKWFVENVQGGKDDCEEYYVGIEGLKELLEACRQVKDNWETGKELLPTQEGFFFGSTEYDEYYKQDIEDTIEIIEGILKEEEEGARGDYYYSSSW